MHRVHSSTLLFFFLLTIRPFTGSGLFLPYNLEPAQK